MRTRNLVLQVVLLASALTDLLLSRRKEKRVDIILLVQIKLNQFAQVIHYFLTSGVLTNANAANLEQFRKLKVKTRNLKNLEKNLKLYFFQ